jgi:hypothetical protein
MASGEGGACSGVGGWLLSEGTWAVTVPMPVKTAKSTAPTRNEWIAEPGMSALPKIQEFSVVVIGRKEHERARNRALRHYALDDYSAFRCRNFAQ